MKCLTTTVLCILMCLFSVVASGSYLKIYSLDELVKNSSYIIRAKVVAINQKAYDKKVKMPYTITTLKITDSLKGSFDLSPQKQDRIKLHKRVSQWCFVLLHERGLV